jgi:beta-glucanase (GH16 family)
VDNFHNGKHPASNRIDSDGITTGILGLLDLGTFTAYGGWRLVWGDKFNGASIDPSHWTFETGNRRGWGNRELEYDTL